MQSVIKRPCQATRIHFQPYGQPNVERKQQPANGTPPQVRAAARQRAATHVGAGSPTPRKSPITAHPGETSGPGMPGPTAGGGQAPAVRKRPRRGQDPSLRTDPPTSARIPPQVRAATRQRAAIHVGAASPTPRKPSAAAHPGKTSGPGMPAPTRGGGQVPCRPQTPAEGSRPPYGPTHQRVPRPIQRLRELHP